MRTLSAISASGVCWGSWRQIVTGLGRRHRPWPRANLHTWKRGIYHTRACTCALYRTLDSERCGRSGMIAFYRTGSLARGYTFLSNVRAKVKDRFLLHTNARERPSLFRRFRYSDVKAPTAARTAVNPRKAIDIN